MKYTYHFYAISNSDFGSGKHMDGIINRKTLLTTWKEYQELREDIAEEHSVKVETVTICSLTLLHQDNGPIDPEKEKTADRMSKKLGV